MTDPLSRKNDHFCEVLEYEPFAKPILAKTDSGYLENIPESRLANYWRDGVRAIDLESYNRITRQKVLSEKTTTSELPPISNDFESRSKEGKKIFRYTAFYERSPKNRAEVIRIHGYSCILVCDKVNPNPVFKSLKLSSICILVA